MAVRWRQLQAKTADDASPVGNKGWYARNGERAKDQQPLMLTLTTHVSRPGNT
ncbi:MAG: hypothetical protein R3C28_26155 [Pirellulaceae bacterium]